jgi:hypothetical protein
MTGLLAPSLVALTAALVAGGSVRNLLVQRFWGWPLFALGFALELALYNPPLDQLAWAMAFGPWLWLITRLVFVGVLLVNGWSGAWPWRVAALGVALNTLVVAVNGGHMPQSPQAALAVWGSSPIDATRLQNITSMSAATPLAWLGDVFAEPRWMPRPTVVSLGDILLSLGVAGWLFSAMRPRCWATGAKIGSWIGTGRWSRARAPESREVRRSFASNLWYR